MDMPVLEVCAQASTAPAAGRRRREERSLPMVLDFAGLAGQIRNRTLQVRTIVARGCPKGQELCERKESSSTQ
jgi:hypothetical protein